MTTSNETDKSASYNHKKSKITLSAAVTREHYCPVCNLKLENDNIWINMHIDACLKRSDEKAYNKQFSDSCRTSTLISHKSIPGLFLLYDFINENEEQLLLTKIAEDIKSPWKHSSFNGHCLSKTYGVKTQFGLPGEERLVRKHIEELGEYDVPDFFTSIINRFEALVNDMNIPNLGGKSFRVNECNINSYSKSAAHYLRPHYDDRALSGPILINLSLVGQCNMTYTKASTLESTSVHLPPRCLQIVSGEARWNYLHGIKAEDIIDEQRISITWRQSGGKKEVKSISATDVGPGLYSSSS
jgi:alkylated DNA repair dioxygenase AlkB